MRSGSEDFYQLLRPLLVGMVGGKMPPHFPNNVLILPRILHRVEQLVGDVAGERELASQGAVNRFRMTGMQHDQGNGIGAEDFEVFRRQQLEPAKQRALGHDRYPALAHGRDHLCERHGRLYLDAKPAEPGEIELKSNLQAVLTRSCGDHVPPKADETDTIELGPDVFDGW